MKVSHKRQSGFTIIELLIVIVVIGILAGLVLNAFGNIQERARDTERQNDINALHTQLELYYTDPAQGNGTYPAAETQAGLETALPNVNAEVLVDPNGTAINDGGDYSYAALPDGCDNTTTTCDSYTLSTTLEASEDTFSRDSVN